MAMLMGSPDRFRVIEMRNLAIAPNAAFQASVRWAKRDLPIMLTWRSSLWRYNVPALWVAGLLLWMWVVSMETPHWGIVLYALLFIGMPLMLAGAAVWWVGQLLHRRTAATFIINDDYLEWQFEPGSDLDPLTDCTSFKLVGKHNFNARIAWDSAALDEPADLGWLGRVKARVQSAWLKADRTLYARDVGLDRDYLESLCSLLNQLRSEVLAQHR